MEEEGIYEHCHFCFGLAKVDFEDCFHNQSENFHFLKKDGAVSFMLKTKFQASKG